MKSLSLKIKITDTENDFELLSKTLASSGSLQWNFLQRYKISADNMAFHTAIQEAPSDAPSGNLLLVAEHMADDLDLADGQQVQLTLSHAPIATSVQVQSAEDSVSSRTLMSGLEVKPDDVFEHEGKVVRITSCDPPTGCIDDSTDIVTQSVHDGKEVTSTQSLGRKASKRKAEGFSSLIGMDDVIEQVQNEILIPMKNPEKAIKWLGGPLKGAILHGSYGTGKTALVRAIAKETGVKLYHIPAAVATSPDGPSFITECYQKAGKKKGGALIYLDEIDAYASDDKAHSAVTTTIQECMDGYKRTPNVFTLAATNHIGNVAQALQRNGRFDLIIEIKLPNAAGRTELFEYFTRNLLMAKPVNFRQLAAKTPAYTGADIETLVKQAGINAFIKHVKTGKVVKITQQDIEAVLSTFQPTGSRRMGVSTPKVCFDDLFGVDSLVRQITPTLDIVSGKKPARYSQIKNLPILLYGPAGTGKTSFAQAIARYLQVSFVCRSAGSFRNMWLGESERFVRELFALARTYAPLVLFIDEIDSLGAERGSPLGVHSDKILNEVLSEMGGVASNEGIYIIGATNRREILDQALLSRFGYQFEMPLPNHNQRMHVIEGLLGKLPREIVDIDSSEISMSMTGWSQRDIAGLVNTLRMKLDLGVERITTNLVLELVESGSRARNTESMTLEGASL